MATARRLYLYIVSAAGLSLLIAGVALLLQLLFSKLGVAYGSGSWGSQLDTVSFGIALGSVGLVLWLVHWSIVERMVRGRPAAAHAAPAAEGAPEAPDLAAGERRSIIRSVYFAFVLGISLLTAATLAVDMAGRAIADRLGAVSYVIPIQPYGDAWLLSITIVMFAIWAYHVWIRGRDVRQGPVIGGSAAWISRMYLYGIAFVSLVAVLNSITSLINRPLYQLAANPPTVTVPGMRLLGEGDSPYWLRPVVGAAVGLAIWGAIWLSHWLYSNRLRSGSTDQSAAECVSRVRLAFLMVVVGWGAFTIVSGCAVGLGYLFDWALGLKNDVPLWYLVIVPPVEALPAGVAWWWHRRRAFGEAPEGPAGVSARRIAGYAVALVGLYALAAGVNDVLSATFARWFAPMPPIGLTNGTDFAETVWKFGVAYGGAVALVGLAVWVWPWFSAQRRRAAAAAERAVELGSSARAYYLYVVAGASVLAGAGSLAIVLYRYLRVGFRLPEPDLGREVSGSIALLLVAVVVLAYHVLVLRGDRAAPRLAVGPMTGSGDALASGPTDSGPGSQPASGS